eukprot:13643116-Alexandrium_andersonii.AAC.1
MNGAYWCKICREHAWSLLGLAWHRWTVFGSFRRCIALSGFAREHVAPWTQVSDGPRSCANKGARNCFSRCSAG